MNKIRMPDLDERMRYIRDATQLTDRAALAELQRLASAAELIGFGENPHGVFEIIDTVDQCIAAIAGSSGRTLVLLETGYWITEFIKSNAHGGISELEAFWTTSNRNGASPGVRVLSLLKTLHERAGQYPGTLDYHGFDIFMHPRDSDVSNVAENIDRNKWLESVSMMNELRHGDSNSFTELRERFMISESEQAIARNNPDRVILYAGSIHASKTGGIPMGEKFIRSVFSVLADMYSLTPLSVLLFGLSGKSAVYKRTGDEIIMEEKPIESFPQLEIQSIFRESLISRPGSVFLTKIPDSKTLEMWHPEAESWLGKHDIVVSFKDVKADTTPKHI